VTERDWDLDRRRFVADERDAAANDREAIADERERLADLREQEADERERALDALARRLGADGSSPAADAAAAFDVEGATGERYGQMGAAAAATRAEARTSRETARVERRKAVDRLQEAVGNDSGGGPLAQAFADLAGELTLTAELDQLLERVVEAAVLVVDECDHASITRYEDGKATTVASTGSQAERYDAVQYEVGEGPSLSAVDEPVVQLDDETRDQWPALAARWDELGSPGLLSCGLLCPVEGPGWPGALNLYSDKDAAFSDHSREVALVLATHCAVAVAVAEGRQAKEDQVANLEQALETRDVIGQAKGVLIGRMGVTPDAAFDMLRRASQRLNLKLRDVARDVVAKAESSPT
jgi:hypothetical protein